MENPTILVLMQKGGVGKSTVCDEIAFSFDRTGIPYSFVDLDGQGGNIHEQNIIEDSITIVDTPGAMPDDIKEYLQDADIIVIPTLPSMRDMPIFERMRQAVRTYAKNKPTILLINRFNSSSTCKQFSDWLTSEGESMGNLQANEIAMILPQSELVQWSLDTGRSITDYKSQISITHRTRMLTNKIRELAGLPLEPDIPVHPRRHNPIIQQEDIPTIQQSNEERK